MSSLFYDLPSDKVTGTWSSDGTLNSLYPFANIDDDQPWNPVKYTANPSGILLDMSVATRVDWVGFIHCNFDLGAVIRVQMNATNSWGSPTVDVPLVIAGPTEDGMPPNPFADLTAASGYTTSGLRYLLVHVVSGQSSLLSLGLVRVSSRQRVFSDASTSNRDRDYGAVDREHHPVIERTTDAGAQVGYSRGTRARWVGGNLRLDATGYAEYLTLKRATRGRFKPSLLVPHPDDENEVMFVKWGIPDTPHQRTWTDYGVFDCPFDAEEVGRGLVP
jgi:hypothetical protein